MFERRIIFKENGSDLSDILLILSKTLFIFFIFSILFILMWFSKSGATFTLKNFEVKGIENSNGKNVSSILEKYRNKNLLNLNLEKVSKKLKALNWYKNVEVSILLPDTLRVVLKEREPFAIVLIGSKLYVVDDNGEVISPFSNKFKYLCKMPMVTGIYSWEDDQAIKEKINLFKNFVNSLKNSGMSKYFSKISEVNVENKNNVIVVVDKIEIKLGSEHFLRKLDKFFKYEDVIVERYGKFLQIDMSTTENKMKIKRMKEDRFVKLEKNDEG